MTSSLHPFTEIQTVEAKPHEAGEKTKEPDTCCCKCAEGICLVVGLLVVVVAGVILFPQAVFKCCCSGDNDCDVCNYCCDKKPEEELTGINSRA